MTILTASASAAAASDTISATRTDMADFLSLFDDWSADLESTLQQQHRHHKDIISEGREELSALSLHHSKLQSKCAGQSDLVDRERGKILELKHRMHALEIQLETLPREIVDIEEKFHRLKQQHLSATQSSEAKVTRSRQQLTAMSDRLRPYQRALGLTFQPRASELAIIFTNISRAKPAEEFSLSIFINAANEYEIVHCSPSLGARSQQLLQELNNPQHNDFNRFLIEIRKAFKQLAQ